MYLWELVSFCSKTSLVFVACLASVSVDSAELSKTIFFATWIALLAFVLEFKYEPYERPVEGRLLKLTEATMLALLLLAQGLNIRGGGGGGGGGGSSSNLFFLLQLLACRSLCCLNSFPCFAVQLPLLFGCCLRA